MKANLFIASFLVVFSLIVHSQKRTIPVKNSVPNTMGNTIPADTPKQYIYRVFPLEAKYIDSVLLSAYNHAGRRLYAEDADKLKVGLANIFNYFRDQRDIQDSAAKVKPQHKPGK